MIIKASPPVLKASAFKKRVILTDILIYIFILIIIIINIYIIGFFGFFGFFKKPVGYSGFLRVLEYILTGIIIFIHFFIYINSFIYILININRLFCLFCLFCLFWLF